MSTSSHIDFNFFDIHNHKNSLIYWQNSQEKYKKYYLVEKYKMNITTLKAQIMSVISTDNFSISALEQILEPIADFVNDPTFITNIGDVVSIITQDRDGNASFDINDITLLSESPEAVMSLVSAVILVISAIPGLKIQYNAATSESIIIKLLAYVFLVIVPAQAKISLSLADKTTIVNIVVSVYGYLQSSQIVEKIWADVVAFFKAHKPNIACPACMSGSSTTATKELLLEKRLPAVKLHLQHSLNGQRQKASNAAKRKEITDKAIYGEKKSKDISKKSNKK